MTMLSSPSAWFSAGRLMACQKMPYFSAAVMGLVPFPMEGLGTLGVTARGVLMWDPGLSSKWSVENLAWVLLHEAGHYLRDHAGRAKQIAAVHQIWNIAGDAEINDDLVAANAVFPPLTAQDGAEGENVNQPSGVVPAHFGCENGKLCEEYYNHLRQNAQVKGSAVCLEGKSTGKGKAGGKSGKGEGKTLHPTTGGGKGCGSGSGGTPLPGEENVPSSMGRSAADQKRIQREVAEAIRTEQSRGRGTVPGGLARWAEETLGPATIPWQQKLARLCRAAVAYRAGAGDYRYDKPSRRQGAYGYGTGAPVFPALRMPVPRVSIIVDTSGSVGDAELTVGLEETKGILSAVGAHVDFFACDAELHSARQIRTIQEARALLKGGGGTNMTPAFEAIARLPQPPDVVVCITDGQIGDPGPKPRNAHVIWLVVGKYTNTQFPWGQVIELDSKDSKGKGK